MIISHKYKCIFLKTGKVGGTSLEIALSKHLGPYDIITPHTPDEEQQRRELGYMEARHYRRRLHEMNPRAVKELLMNATHSRPSHTWPRKFINHSKADHIKATVSQEVWDGYFKFTVERNPFDLAVSRYHFRERLGKVGTFRDFVLSGESYRRSNFDIYAIRGMPVVDYIIRYEQLDNDLHDITKRIGYPEDIATIMNSITAKSGYRSERDYRSYYDEDTKRAIEIQFAREIALMGYTF